MSKKYNDENHETEYLDDGYVNTDEPSDTFFTLEDSDEAYDERERSDRTKLLMAALLFFSVILAVILGILGARAFSQASDDATYADKTWVVSGTFKDLTPDLNTKSNVAVYDGKIPADADIKDKTYHSQLGDPAKVSAGSAIEFRGSDTGKSKSDFPEKVDGLLAESSNGYLEVIRTGDPGEIEPITASSVNGTRMRGIAEFVGALLVLGGGIAGALVLAKRQRRELAESL